MKAVRFDTLLDGVRAYLPGCEDALLLRTFRTKAREFCRRSQCWLEDITVNLVAETKAYTVTSAYDADIRRVRNVWLRTATDVANGDYGLEQELSAIKFTPPSTLTLPQKSYEAVTSGMIVRVVLTPTYNSNEIGADIIELWGHAIEAGVKADPGQPWTDPDGAATSKIEFENGVTQADVDTEKQFMQVEQSAVTGGWLI